MAKNKEQSQKTHQSVNDKHKYNEEQRTFLQERDLFSKQRARLSVGRQSSAL